MGLSADLKTYYYTPYHLARDLLGATAAFTFFLVLAVALRLDLQRCPWSDAWPLSDEPSWLLAAAAVAGYFLTAYASGLVATGIFLYRASLESTVSCQTPLAPVSAQV